LQDDGSCQFPVLGSPNFFLYGGELLFIGAGGKDISALFGQLCENGCNLCWSLTLSQDDFGHSVPQGTMVVDFGESEVFKGQMAQARHGIVGSEFATAYVFKQFADGVGVHNESVRVVRTVSRVAFRARGFCSCIGFARWARRSGEALEGSWAGVDTGSCVRLPDYPRRRFLQGECPWIVILYSESARGLRLRPGRLASLRMTVWALE